LEAKSGLGTFIRLDPILDMINYQGSESTMIYNSSVTKDILTFASKINLDPYMPLSRLIDFTDSKSYFQYLGWIPDNFPVQDDNYDLLLGVNENDKLFQRKVAILKKAGWHIKQIFTIKSQLFLCDIESDSSRINFEKLFAFIRICQANDGTSFD